MGENAVSKGSDAFVDGQCRSGAVLGQQFDMHGWPLARHPRANCAFPKPSTDPHAHQSRPNTGGAIELTQQPP